MLFANKEAIMTVINTLNFIAFDPLESKNSIVILGQNLNATIDEQIKFAANKDFTHK